MSFTIEIPKELWHLRKDVRGYPIPFFVPIVEGKPNFKYLDAKKQVQCIDRHICPICGKKLYSDFCYVISGLVGLKNQVHTDPAMHRVCAEFTLKACPHLFFEKSERKADGDSPLLMPKPAELFLVKCSKFKKVDNPHGGLLIRFTPVSTEKYVYVDNKLTKQ